MDYTSQAFTNLFILTNILEIHTTLIFRSSWEFRFCKYCDTNEKILKWSSEPLQIPYYNPLDKKEHTYNVDFYMRVLKDDGTEAEWNRRD